MIFNAYREFNIDKVFDHQLIQGTIGVNAEIKYESSKGDRWEPGWIEVEVRKINSIEFFQVVSYKVDDDGEIIDEKKRKMILSIEDKNIKKIKDYIIEWLTEKFENDYVFDQDDIIDF